MCVVLGAHSGLTSQGPMQVAGAVRRAELLLSSSTRPVLCCAQFVSPLACCEWRAAWARDCEGPRVGLREVLAAAFFLRREERYRQRLFAVPGVARIGAACGFGVNARRQRRSSSDGVQGRASLLCTSSGGGSAICGTPHARRDTGGAGVFEALLHQALFSDVRRQDATSCTARRRPARVSLCCLEVCGGYCAAY